MSAATIAFLISFLPEVPQIFTVVEQLIARGQANGELPADQAEALTVLAKSLFAQHATPAPPPPGTTAGPG